MEITLEIFKTFHFLVMVFIFLAFSLWIREEFITIFNRKSVANFSILKVLLVRAFGENNGLYIESEKKKSLSLFYYAATIFCGIFPLFFMQMSDRIDLFGSESFLGLVTSENSWLYFFSILFLGEVFRSLYDRTYQKGFIKILILLAIMLTFVSKAPSFSIEQMVQYQKSFNEWGLRNYFLMNNPLGLVLMLLLFISEIENPKSPFTLINHIYLNTYIILFIYGFLGGYGLPSILEKQNIIPGIETVFLQNISLLAKFVFCIIVVWVFKYSLIKLEKEFHLND